MKLIMPHQLIALVISDNHVSHIFLSHLCQKQLVCFDYIQFCSLFDVTKIMTKLSF
jgi:hypothetical protein